MSSPDTIQIQVAGHEIRLKAEEHETAHIERAATKVTETIQKLQRAVGGTATPAKIATMAAFEFAFELSLADAMLADAERLHEQLQAERDSVKRLETLLARVDDALAY